MCTQKIYEYVGLTLHFHRRISVGCWFGYPFRVTSHRRQPYKITKNQFSTKTNKTCQKWKGSIYFNLRYFFVGEFFDFAFCCGSCPQASLERLSQLRTRHNKNQNHKTRPTKKLPELKINVSMLFLACIVLSCIKLILGIFCMVDAYAM